MIIVNFRGYFFSNLSVEITTKQTVAASPENDSGGCSRLESISNHCREELNAPCEPEAKVSQPTVNGLREGIKANSGVGNKSAGQEKK